MKYFFLIPVFLLGCENSKKETVIYSHRLSREYTTVYPYEDELYYHKIVKDDNTDSARFLFSFVNTFQDFKNYEFQQDSGKIEKNSTGEYQIVFNKNSPENVNSRVKIKIILQNNDVRNYEMNLSFDLASVQQKKGRNASSDGLFIRQTNVSFLEILRDDFLKYEPTDEEKKYIQKAFRAKLTGVVSQKEKVNILVKEVIDLTEKHRGIPTDEMDTLPVMEQLKRLKSGKEKVWCGNIANIFRAVCVCFDIPARRIGLGSTYDEKSQIYHSDYHTTTEVYDKEKKSWYLVDLSFYLLEAKNQKGEPLNFVDFFYFLNSPDEQKNILVSEYNPEQKKTNIVKVAESKKISGLIDFYKRNQKFYFEHKNGYFGF